MFAVSGESKIEISKYNTTAVVIPTEIRKIYKLPIVPIESSRISKQHFKFCLAIEYN